MFMLVGLLPHHMFPATIVALVGGRQRVTVRADELEVGRGVVIMVAIDMVNFQGHPSTQTVCLVPATLPTLLPISFDQPASEPSRGEPILAEC